MIEDIIKTIKEDDGTNLAPTTLIEAITNRAGIPLEELLNAGGKTYNPATHEADGLMSKEDKFTFDSLFESIPDKTMIVVPFINSLYTLMKNDGTIVWSDRNTIPSQLESGYKYNWKGTWGHNAVTINNKPPKKFTTSYAGEWGNGNLEQEYNTIYNNGIEAIKTNISTSNLNLGSVTLYADKIGVGWKFDTDKGILVKNTDVIDGYKTTTILKGPVFLDRVFYGNIPKEQVVTTEIVGVVTPVTSLENVLNCQNSELRNTPNFNWDISNNSPASYSIYAIPKTLGQLKNQFLELNAMLTYKWIESEVELVNDAGIVVPMWVYTSPTPGTYINFRFQIS